MRFSVFFCICLLYAPFLFTPFSSLSAATTHNSALPSSCPQLSQIDPKLIQSGLVKWLPDGDTIHTAKGYKLRLLHINTPEINPTSAKVAEPYARQAKKRLSDLIGSSQKIYWFYDQRKKDRYKRQLAFVFNQQGLLLNAALVAEGLAHTLVILPNQRYWSCINDSQNQARQRSIGIWSNEYFSAEQASKLKVKRGSRLVKGKITKIVITKKYQWLILDGKLWVGIATKNRHYFKKYQAKFKQGQSVTLRGYIYQSYGKLRLKLSHPAMLLL